MRFVGRSLVAGLAARPALAAVITVNSTADNTTDDDVCTLRKAIEVANGTLVRDECGAGDAGQDEIRFAASTNTDDIDLALGQLVTDDDLRIVGNGPSNTIVDGNNATRVLVVNGGVEAELVGLTIRDGNSAGDGGGIFNEFNTTTLRVTILADSTPENCFVVSGSLASTGFNLSDDDTCAAFFTATGDRNNTDPELGPLANNGGPTRTHALLPGSPAIDAIDGSCPPPSSDQRGVARPQDGDGSSSRRCDIGAFEVEEEEAAEAAAPAVARGPDPRPETVGDEPNKKKPTEEQELQKERTNTGGRDDVATEGNVLAVHCDEEPHWVLIANRDGDVKLLLHHEARAACREIRVGDYLEASGEKEHEQLFEAHDLTIRRGRGR